MMQDQEVTNPCKCLIPSTPDETVTYLLDEFVC